MKSLFTKERPKTNEQRLYDWEQRKNQRSKQKPDDEFLYMLIAALAIVGVIVSVLGIMHYMSSNIQVTYPILP